MITSLKNPKVKFVLGLRDRKVRRSSNSFLVEGARELERAISSGWHVRELFFCTSVLSDLGVRLISMLDSDKKVEISQAVFKKVALRESAGGVIGVLEQKSRGIQSFNASLMPGSLFILLEGVEKPGNLGAVLRTADGVGASGVILVDSVIDLFNPNVIRSSLGAFFSTPVVECSFDDFKCWAKTTKLNVVSTFPDALSSYFEVSMREASVIVFGSEDRGLKPRWVGVGDKEVSIPMMGIGDSLNLSVSVAILAYECLRQRGTR